MRFHLVVNPVAGRNRAGPLADDLAERLRGAGATVRLARTTGPGDAGRLVADLAPDATDRVVVVGGDGTLREAVNARPLPLPWPLGLVPVGTANVVGRELRMPLTSEGEPHARALLTAEPWSVNALELTYDDGRREIAVANLGVGLDAEVVRAVSMARAKRHGLGGYAVWVQPILATVARYRAPRLRVRVDGARLVEASAVVVQGGRSYGGVFELSPTTSLDAPTMSVALVMSERRRDLFRLLARALVKRAAGDQDLVLLPAREIRIESDRQAGLQTDGDPGGYTPVTVRLVPKALTLLRAPAGMKA
jgi:diacylglycerol kinase family enzyme